MSHLLDPFDPGLLQVLGCQGRLEQFGALLEPPDSETREPVRRFRWQPSVNPDQRLAAGAGILLMFQRIDPHAQPDQTQWALRGITLHTALSPMSKEAWSQAWPANLPAENATLQDIRAVFGEPALNTPDLSIFAIQGPQNQRRALQCQFSQAGRLQTFTVMHVDSWQPLPEIQPAPAQPEPASAPPVTCFSGGTVPKTGWYEGQLPPDHPSHALYSQLDARFAYRQAGQHMCKLGVQPPRQEALVVWTWIGQQLAARQEKK